MPTTIELNKQVSIFQEVTNKAALTKQFADYTPKSTLEAAKIILLKGSIATKEFKALTQQAYKVIEEKSNGESFTVEGLTVTPSYNQVKTSVLEENSHTKKLLKKKAKLEKQIAEEQAACAALVAPRQAELAGVIASLEVYTETTVERGKLKSISVK